MLLVLTLGSGLVFYNLSVYLNLLSEQRGFSVAAMSGAVTAMFLIGAPVGIVVGRLIQQHDVRVILAAGSVMVGAALMLLGEVRAVWHVYAVYVLMGVGYSCVSLIPATTLIARWFDDARRPIAMSFAATGLSLGGVVFTPLTVLLMSVWSFERSMLAIGVVFTVAILPIAWFGVSPWPAGAAPDGKGGAGDAGPSARSRFFIGVTVAYVFNMAAQVGGITHLFNRARELLDPIDASFAVSILGTGSIIGRLVGGWVVTQIPMRGFVLGNMAGQTVGLAILALAGSRGVIWAGAALFGVTMGNLLMLHPLVLADAYPVRHFPRLYSLSQSFTSLGVAGGPLLVGWIHDGWGYVTAFAVGAVASFIAIAVFAASGPAPRHDQAGDDHGKSGD